jgi:hypothetical protein
MNANKLFPFFLVLGACQTDADPLATESPDSPAESARVIAWDIDGLAPLGEGTVYESWLIVDGAPVSAGRFTVDAEGIASLDAFEVTADQEANATAFVLTLEPEPDADPGPSATKLLGGDFDGNWVDLEVSHAAALGTDFTDAMAEYILETPSTMGIHDDFDAGIWWLDPTGDTPMGSLVLPELPDGWIYEGWVVGADGPMSTGRFATADQQDSDAAGMSAGPDSTPAFPGQDYIDPELLLSGLTAVISVEPQPDDSEAPFLLKPLVDSIDVVDAGVLQGMSNNAAATNPMGGAWFE